MVHQVKLEKTAKTEGQLSLLPLAATNSVRMTSTHGVLFLQNISFNITGLENKAQEDKEDSPVTKVNLDSKESLDQSVRRDDLVTRVNVVYQASLEPLAT